MEPGYGEEWADWSIPEACPRNVVVRGAELNSLYISDGSVNRTLAALRNAASTKEHVVDENTNILTNLLRT